MFSKHPKSRSEWPVDEALNLVKIAAGRGDLELKVVHYVQLKVEHLFVLDARYQLRVLAFLLRFNLVFILIFALLTIICEFLCTIVHVLLLHPFQLFRVRSNKVLLLRYFVRDLDVLSVFVNLHVSIELRRATVFQKVIHFNYFHFIL